MFSFFLNHRLKNGLVLLFVTHLIKHCQHAECDSYLSTSNYFLKLLYCWFGTYTFVVKFHRISDKRNTFLRNSYLPFHIVAGKWLSWWTHCFTLENTCKFIAWIPSIPVSISSTFLLWFAQALFSWKTLFDDMVKGWDRLLMVNIVAQEIQGPFRTL